MSGSTSILMLAPLLLSLGCSQGTIRWEDGHDRVRTVALYASSDPADYLPGNTSGVRGLTVLLTNGAFECNELEGALADERLEVDLNNYAAICREGAKHLLFDLYAIAPSPAEELDLLKSDNPWTWWQRDYPGILAHEVESAETELKASGGHVVHTDYFAIHEAGMWEGDGLAFLPQAIEGQTQADYDVGATVTLTLDSLGQEHIAGSFSLPNQRVHGSFRGKPCWLSDYLYRRYISQAIRSQGSLEAVCSNPELILQSP